ncbi:hypothetical protein LHYA1_G009188 [Lachnellula hyalina]|uniref:Uncharacterized protein n=1 Tax=Lachnellula hyalina TaxID=1316788 RepID=A0A8H8QSV5_9HELO|nr:uncharacterized protein LHYA1_G009188 [Lachnellula hyalina]TVY22163.1 hypothetical protein LHYA1_G009188 [Lachnellula hyalina]
MSIYNTQSVSETNLSPRTLSSFIHLNNTLPPQTAPPTATATAHIPSTYTQRPGTQATTSSSITLGFSPFPSISAISSTTSLSLSPTTTYPTDPSATAQKSIPIPTSTPSLKMHHHAHNRVVETRTTKPTLMTRLRGRNANTRTVKTTTKVEPATHNHVHHNQHHTTHTTHTRGRNTRTAQPVHHHKRRVSVGDKVSGAMMKLRGSLTRRPGLKAAGTRRMHGTDGRGSHRTY